MKKQIAILGSTGSIGTQALEVIEEHSDLYEVYCLTANNKVELLAQQAHQFKPAAIVIANEARYDELKRLMSDMPEVKVYAGARALDDAMADARAAFDWDRQFTLCLDPEHAKSRWLKTRAFTDEAHTDDHCSMCGKEFCAVRTSRRIRELAEKRG